MSSILLCCHLRIIVCGEFVEAGSRVCVQYIALVRAAVLFEKVSACVFSLFSFLLLLYCGIFIFVCLFFRESVFTASALLPCRCSFITASGLTALWVILFFVVLCVFIIVRLLPQAA